MLVQRLCGICPVSHHLAAAKAMDRIVGGEKLTPTAEKMRRLMHYGQMFQSHALHFFHLCSPGPAVRLRRRPGHPQRHRRGRASIPELAVQGVMMRKYGQEIIKATAGKKIHGTGAIPGGINKNLSIAERDGFLKDIEQMMDLVARRAEDRQGLHRRAPGDAAPTSARSTRTTCRSSAPTAPWTSTTATCAPSTPRARRSSTRSTTRTTSTTSPRRCKPWSYMKFPFIKSLGPENGWYRVGPLARINTCDFIDTPEAEAARKEFMALTERQAEQHHHGLPLGADDRAAALDREDPRPAATTRTCRARTWWSRASAATRASASIEAPRGTLFHHYQVNENDQVDDGQPDRLDDQQQRADEPGGAEGRRRTTSPASRRSPRGC